MFGDPFPLVLDELVSSLIRLDQIALMGRGSLGSSGGRGGGVMYSMGRMCCSIVYVRGAV